MKEKIVQQIDDNAGKIIDISHKVWEGSLPMWFSLGSTDVGDVSWQTPEVQFTAVTFTAHSPGHSWQNVSSSASTIGDKGTIYASKVLALTAADLFERPDIIEAAKAELKDRLAGEEYLCPIPNDAVPYIIEEV